ncbi:MAG TPA: lactonase family protein [Chloroflexota bacterium]|nr:lactonase family protein [Chloroflexota bacterium]
MTTIDQERQQPDEAGESGEAGGRARRRQAFVPLGVAGIAAAAALAPGAAQAQQTQQAQAGDPDDAQEAERARRGVNRRFVYVGTYTKPNTAPGGTKPSTAEGLYVFAMDTRTGALQPVQVVKDNPPDEPLPNPSWLTLDPSQTHLYATSEVSSWRGTANTGGVTAFSVDATSGMLARLNDQPSGGQIPAVVTPDPSGRYIVIGNYVGQPPDGTFAVLPIQDNGQLGPATDVYPVTGTGPDRNRQEAPHPHDVKFDPAGKFIAGPDLGTDRIWVWTLNLGTGRLVPVPPPDPPYGQVAGGSGPRHMSFHPRKPYAYVIDEMVSSVTAFKYDPTRGTFIWLQTVSTLPPRFSGHSSTAEIIVHPSGKWVYGSNRGHNSIVVYAIDQDTGKLDPVEWQSTQGEIPRGFNIDPSGTLLLAGNQNSDTIVPFHINQATGRLRPTGHPTSTPVPVCIQFGRPVP